jgi:hypothetical protein
MVRCSVLDEKKAGLLKGYRVMEFGAVETVVKKVSKF